MSIVLAKQPPTIPGYRRLQQHWQKLLQQHRKLFHGFDSAESAMLLLLLQIWWNQGFDSAELAISPTPVPLPLALVLP